MSAAKHPGGHWLPFICVGFVACAGLTLLGEDNRKPRISPASDTVVQTFQNSLTNSAINVVLFHHYGWAPMRDVFEDLGLTNRLGWVRLPDKADETTRLTRTKWFNPDHWTRDREPFTYLDWRHGYEPIPYPRHKALFKTYPLDPRCLMDK